MYMNWKRIVKYICLVLLTLLAVVAIRWAFVNGQYAGQSRQALKDGRAIAQALEYFYQDQNRYPSTDEFTDQNLMRQYLSGFPPQQYVSPSCPARNGGSTFGYVNNFRKDYELRICLPKAVKGYNAGWNKITAPKKS
jgi:type II secretory pathway pseudopilin PulG